MKHAPSVLLVVSAVVVGSLLTAGQACAEDHYELAVRSGYGVPLGAATDAPNDGLAESVSGQIPVWFDLGARLYERVFIGAYVSYGFASVGKQVRTACDEADRQLQPLGGSETCTGHDVRFGAELLYHLGEVGAATDPWFGAGFGYEWVGWEIVAEAQARKTELNLSSGGLELMNLQAGLDLRASEHVAFGLFAALTFGQYDNFRAECSGYCAQLGSVSGSIPNKALHEWFFVGIKATVVP